MSLKHMAGDYAERKAGEAIASVRERTEEKLGAGTVWRVILLTAVVVAGLFIPADLANGAAAYLLPFVVLVVLWLSGNIVVRIKHKAIPQFRRTLAHSFSWMLLFGLSLVVAGVKMLLPSAYFLWVIASAAFAVAAIVLGARAALGGVKEAADEIAHEERLLYKLARGLNLPSKRVLEFWQAGDMSMEALDGVPGGLAVELHEDHADALLDRDKLIAKFAEVAPEYQLENIDAREGTFELHPVSADTRRQRENLQASGNLTSETFDIDEGDVRRGRTDHSDFSLDD